MNRYETKAFEEYNKFWENDRWYYSIELEPGRFTQGFDFPNVALTRHLLNKISLHGAECLDISAADGLISLIMSRKGAKKVVATDRNDFSSHFETLKEHMDFDYSYYANQKLFDIAKNISKETDDGLFDLVVTSGLLYHVYSPLNHLAEYRSLLRTNGLMVVETAIWHDQNDIQIFNTRKSIYDDLTTYWLISPSLFLYMLRLLRLEPINFVTLPPANFFKRAFGRRANRMAVLCRAIDNVSVNDEYIHRAYYSKDFLDYTDWSVLSSISHHDFGLIDSNIDVSCHINNLALNDNVIVPKRDDIRLKLTDF